MLSPSLATTSTTLFAWSGIIDRKGPAVPLQAVQGLDRRLCFIGVVHLDKAETLGAPRVSVHDDLG
jgi:hypothetical protein